MAKKKKKIPQKFQVWIDARKRYGLSHVHIQMARELGMNPKKFGKLSNHKQETWKAPLPEFIEEIYFKRFGKTEPDVVRPIEQVVKEQNKKKQEKKRRKEEKRLEQAKKEQGKVQLKIEFEIEEPEDAGKIFPNVVQRLIVLFNVDMSWQICLNSSLLPPIEVLNDYLRCGISDLGTNIIWGKELKFRLELPNGTLEPGSGTVKWEPFTVIEKDYEIFQEILGANEIKLRIETFGNENMGYKKWFSKAVDF